MNTVGMRPPREGHIQDVPHYSPRHVLAHMHDKPGLIRRYSGWDITKSKWGKGMRIKTFMMKRAIVSPLQLFKFN